jgi:hypothetical protein
MNDGEREAIIRASIAACNVKGIKLAHSTWGICWNKGKGRWLPKGNCCALSCVILEQQDNQKLLNWRAWTIEKILNVDGQWIQNFQRGFDGYEKSAYDNGSFAYELGSLMREEFLPK